MFLQKNKELFSVKINKNNKNNIIISKKYLTKATERNLLKRRIKYFLLETKQKNLNIFLKEKLLKAPKYKKIKEELQKYVEYYNNNSSI